LLVSEKKIEKRRINLYYIEECKTNNNNNNNNNKINSLLIILYRILIINFIINNSKQIDGKYSSIIVKTKSENKTNIIFGLVLIK
jgi:hypothetical protein